jgi:hypothetical protein
MLTPEWARSSWIVTCYEPRWPRWPRAGAPSQQAAGQWLEVALAVGLVIGLFGLSVPRGRGRESHSRDRALGRL